ncbi:hypothetical protein PENSUB_11251, partial [Penicillium subrubescens]
LHLVIRQEVLDSIAIGAPQQRPERVGILISIGRVPRLDGIDIQVIESVVEDGLGVRRCVAAILQCIIIKQDWC